MAAAKAPSSPGLMGEPLIGLGGRCGEARINSNDSASVENIAKFVDGAGNLAVGTKRVAAPRHQAGGFSHIVITVTEEAPCITRVPSFQPRRRWRCGRSNWGCRRSWAECRITVQWIWGNNDLACTSISGSLALRSSSILSAIVSRASSQVIGTNLGSMPRPFSELVRFIGTLIRSGSYVRWIIRCPRGRHSRYWPC